MTIEEIKQKILEQFPGDYREGSFEKVLMSIESFDPTLRTEFETFLTSGEKPTRLIEGYSVKNLCEEQGLNGIGAFLTFNWLVREPIEAAAALRKGHDFVK